MATLHARLNGTHADPILAAKGIRAALASLSAPDTGLARASALVEVAQERGIVYVASHADTARCEYAAQAGEHASNGNMAFHVNMPPEPGEKAEAKSLRLVHDAPAPEPEPDAEATALTLMGMTNGNPLIAAVYAQKLAGTANAPVFIQARDSLIRAFPWIKAKIESGEIA